MHPYQSATSTHSCPPRLLGGGRVVPTPAQDPVSLLAVTGSSQPCSRFGSRLVSDADVLSPFFVPHRVSGMPLCPRYLSFRLDRRSHRGRPRRKLSGRGGSFARNANADRQYARESRLSLSIVKTEAAFCKGGDNVVRCSLHEKYESLFFFFWHVFFSSCVRLLACIKLWIQICYL